MNPTPAPHAPSRRALPALAQVKQQVESQIVRRLSPSQLPNALSSPVLLLCVSSKVRDLSHTSASIAPADYASWHDVRTELMAEAKTGFKARVEAELAAGTLAACHHPVTTLPRLTTALLIPANGSNLDELKAAFQQEERAIEHEIDHTVNF